MGPYRAVSLGIFAAFLTNQAHAACPVGQEAFTSCQIEGRSTEVFVCHDDRVATYGYGPIGQPAELSLLDTVENVDFEPWSGLGKAIYERITLYNGDYSYEVGGGFDRPFSEEEMLLDIRRFGWIDVAQNGEVVSRLECIPETVTYGFGGGIYDAKVNAGLAWDEDSETWLPDVDRPTTALPRVPVLTKGTHNGVIEECMPSSEFELSNVKMGYRVADLGKLVPPVVGEVITGDVLEIERFMYDGLRMDVYQGVIIELEATSPLWEMPSGLKVGLTRGEVISILGRVPNDDAATSQRFFSLACMGSQNTDPIWYVVIEFGQDKRVQSISFADLSP